MKKILAMLICFVLVFSLTGCGGSTESGEEKSESTVSGQEKGISKGKGTRNDPYGFNEEIIIDDYVWFTENKEFTSYSLNLTSVSSGTALAKKWERYEINDCAIGLNGSLSVKSENADDSINMDISFAFLDKDMNELSADCVQQNSDSPSDRLSNVYADGKYDILIYSNNSSGIDPEYLVVTYRAESEEYKKIWIAIDKSLKSKEDLEIEKSSQIEAEIGTKPPVTDKAELEALIEAQEVKVVKTKYVVQDEDYKALYPDMLEVVIINGTKLDIKNAVVAYVAWDSNNLPVKIVSSGVDISGGDYVRKCNFSDINLIPGAKYGEGYGYSIDENCGIKTFKAIVVSYEAFDGTTWENPYYEDWCAVYAGTKLGS